MTTVLYVLWAGVLLIWPAVYAALLVFVALARTAEAVALTAVGMFLVLVVGLLSLPASNDGRLLAFLLAVVLLSLSALLFALKLALLRWKARSAAA